MKFFLTGVETQNKGAELMLYAILQEIERRHPGSTVYIKENRIKQGPKYINTKLNLVAISASKFYLLINKIKINSILKRFLGYSLYDTPIVKDVDFLFDGSGLHFSDQTIGGNKTIYIYWEKLLKGYRKENTKIVFLPQGFGPVLKKPTIKSIESIDKYADLVYAREEVSYDYLEKSKAIDMSKVKIMTDFTSLVDGVVPEEYKHLVGAVCIIPNMQMVRRGGQTLERYLSYLMKVILLCQNQGYRVYLLNHEGSEDEELAIMCKKRCTNIEVVSGLDAIHTKGMISSAYLVISSRFHGVASSLNCCVPCLATSWSHKYQLLFEDYKQDNSVLSMEFNQDKTKIIEYLNAEYNSNIRSQLSNVVPLIKVNVKKMWNEIWSLK